MLWRVVLHVTPAVQNWEASALKPLPAERNEAPRPRSGGAAGTLPSAALPLLQWFLANLSYQEALSGTQVAIVNILSSSSGEPSEHAGAQVRRECVTVHEGMNMHVPSPCGMRKPHCASLSFLQACLRSSWRPCFPAAAATASPCPNCWPWL